MLTTLPAVLANLVRCCVHGHPLTQHKKTMTYESIVHATFDFTSNVHVAVPPPNNTRLTNIAITRWRARCRSRLIEFAAENTIDTGSGLSQEANAC